MIKDVRLNTKEIENSKTVYIGKNIKYFNEIESTQDYAKDNFEELVDGTVIVTDNQTKGKGTKGTSWFGGINTNIAMTIVLKKEFFVSQLQTLTRDIAKIVKDSVKELYNIELQIKEPNDLLLNNKKICGILTEAKVLKEKTSIIFIGIGFNVNETRFPEELDKIVTSLKKEYGHDFSREDIIVKILEKLEKYIDNL